MADKLNFESDHRPLCKYSPNCYQKNSEHTKKFKHHPVKNFGIFNVMAKNNKRKLEDDPKDGNLNVKKDESFKKVENQAKVCKTATSTNDEEFDSKKEENREKCGIKLIDYNLDNKGDESLKEIENETKVCKISTASSNEDNVTQIKSPIKEDKHKETSMNYHTVPSNFAEFIEDKFLVKMPEDFYKFWEFYSSDDKFKNAMSGLSLSLVGPFNVLQGNLSIRDNKSDYLIHWRHYYDPPEFQTILMSTEDEFHIGYYRDSPTDLPNFLASNKGNDCKIQPMAENIFGALLSYIQNKDIKNVFRKSEIESFAKEIKKFAIENKFTLDTNSAEMKKRLRSVVAKTFHGAGIVVPYNKKTQLGYRPLIEKDDVIKKILKNLVEAKSDKERDSVRSTLQPILTMASIATDECDFGTGLELGIDMFCYGESVLHGYAENFLTIAYNMLNRDAFGEIAKVHLSNRRKGSKLSVDHLD